MFATLPSLAQPRSLSLNEAVELAIGQNPNVVEAQAASEQARLGVLRAQLDRVSLKIDAQVQELWVKPSLVATPDGLVGLSNLGAQLQVPLFSGFRVHSNVLRAQSLEAAGRENLEDSQRLTALAAARAYIAVQRLDAAKAAQQASLERLVQSEQIAERRLSAGLAPPLDRNRAEVQRLHQVAELASVEGQLESARQELSVLLGIDGPIVLTDLPPEDLPALEPMAAYVERAQSSRPDLARARLETQAMEYRVQMARAGYFPQLSGYGLLQFGNNPYLATSGVRAVSDSVDPFRNVAGTAQVGLTLSMNLFDTLQTYTAVKDASYDAARAKARQESQRRIIDSEVRTAHARAQQSLAQRTPIAKARALASDNLTILRKRYQNGDALMLELLDSELDLLRAERQWAEVKAQSWLAWLELKTAVGERVGVHQ